MSLHSLFIETTPFLVNCALLMIRLFIGICFVIHGFGKLGLVGSGNMLGFESWLKSMNLPYPALQARLAMLTEICGGLLLSLGLMTRLGAIMCVIVMLVAALIGHKGGGYLITNNPPGNEYALNLAAICTLIFLFGPGQFSLDSFIF